MAGRDQKSGIKFSTSLGRTLLNLLPRELVHLGLNLPNPVYFEETPTFRILPVIGMLLILLYLTNLARGRPSQTLYGQMLGVYV